VVLSFFPKKKLACKGWIYEPTLNQLFSKQTQRISFDLKLWFSQNKIKELFKEPIVTLKKRVERKFPSHIIFTADR